MSYGVKEIFLTVQGEGANAGRPAVFCRFSGCNLWSGHERDRSTAVCRFCDTDFVGTDGPGGGVFITATELAAAISRAWPSGVNGESTSSVRPFVVFTGGEPLLQLDHSIINEMHQRGFEIAIETNGTRPVPAGVDWICVSPKAGVDLVQRRGDELKVVFPQVGAEPARFESLEFRHFFLQPMDGPERESNTALALRYCLAHPRWWMSVQTHKFLGIP
jgi:7-carboxy-7-deazaguanine synthase (Cx14CxxC type)